VEFVKVDSDNPDNVNDTEEVRGAWLEGIDVGNMLGETVGSDVLRAEGANVGKTVGLVVGAAVGIVVGDKVFVLTDINDTSPNEPMSPVYPL
jgi:hypothetical protein